MEDPFVSAFENPAWHARVSEIIRRRSTNPTDVREAVLKGLNLSLARRVLDLGCGFGFMSDAVAQRVAPDAEIIGVDACATNQQPYLERLSGSGRRVRFLCRRIDRELDWPTASFDLVLASYALYFFPQVLPEVARVLAPDGLFVTVTHTEQSCRDLLRAAGLASIGARLPAVVGQFSADNAEQLLAPWFERVRRVDYRNTLVFEPAYYDEFLIYLRFKLPLLLPDPASGGRLAEPLANSIRAALSGRRRLVIEKSDAAFHCWGPRCR